MSGGGGVHPLHPPARSAPLLYVSGKLLTNPSLKPALTLTSHSYWWWITIQTWVVLLIRWGKFSTNQKHCSGLDSDRSSVSNFCSCFSFRVETSGGVLKVLAVFPLPLSYIIKMGSVEQGLKWLLVEFENLLDLVIPVILGAGLRGTGLSYALL